MDGFTNAPGKKTSEFYSTVIAQVISSVVAIVALFSPGFTIDPTTQGVVVSFASSAILLSQMVYAYSRSKVKEAAALTAPLSGVSEPPVAEDPDAVSGSGSY